MGQVRTPMHKMDPESSISLNRRQVKQEPLFTFLLGP